MTQDPNKALIGIVIRADGTVPFDDSCPNHMRAQMLAHLTDLGHSLEPVHGTRHVKIKNWKPPAQPAG